MHQEILRSVNPFTQQLIAEYPQDTDSATTRKIEKAHNAFRSWKESSFSERSACMRNAAKLLVRKKEEYATIISSEMGKVFTESLAEVEKCAGVCDYYATHAEKFLADELVGTEAKRSMIAYQPMGVVLAIMPWNFPFWQVFRFAAPALMAGNVGLLKHAANVSGCAVTIQEIFQEAGFPEGTFQTLLIDSKSVEAVISRDEIAAVTLTGSEFAGSEVASIAGKHLKKIVLELGGSDPFIVMEDADLELAAKIATQSRMQNAGQSCIAAKRFIVVKSVADEFLERFVSHVKALRQGDPFDKNTTTGPMARVDLAETVEQQIQRSLQVGASLIAGGTRSHCNFKPTIINKVKPGMPAFDEEVFGPVAAVINVKDEEEAISMANHHRYGLGASVWTQDRERGERVARNLECGCVFVNSLMRSDQRLPFGGVKKSGYGRELSYLGIREFMNAKTIYIN